MASAAQIGHAAPQTGAPTKGQQLGDDPQAD